MHDNNQPHHLQRIVFMGTPTFSVNVLKCLIKSKYTVVLIVSQPDKPKGRGLSFEPTPVKLIAQNYQIECFQPEDVNSEESIYYISTYNPDLIFTLAYGNYICRKLRRMPTFGAVNLHPSLLPLHRGADPIRATLLSGDTKCGISVFFLTSQMDSGQIVSRETFDIPVGTNYTRLETYLSEKACQVALNAIELVATKPRDSFPEQDHTKATYSQKIKPDSNAIDFNQSGEVFMNRLRAYTDEPGYFCTLRGQRLKIFDAEITENKTNHDCGIIDSLIKNVGFVITLPDATLLVKEVQYSGKRKMSAWQFHIGARLQIGEKLYNGI